jgi:signal peptidase I
MAKSHYDYSFRLRQELHRKIRRVVFFIALVVASLALFLRYILFPVSLHTASMEPTLHSGSMLFVSPLFAANPYIPFFDLKRGDVVLVVPWQRQLPFYIRALDAAFSFVSFQKLSLATFGFPSRERGYLSRVIGFPGDTIYMKDCILYIKPENTELFLTEFELREKDYEIRLTQLPDSWDDTLGVAGSFSERTLGGDEFFLLCDNRISFADSRIWGAVRNSRIVGRAVLNYFPFDSLLLL